MQDAIPYETWLTVRQENSISRPKFPMNDGSLEIKGKTGDLKNMVSENAVIVFGTRGCCMSHVVKHLLQTLGVNPAIYEVDEKDETSVVNVLEIMIGGNRKEGEGQLQFPAVFIGGRLFGGLDRIMSTHITGELTPILKQAGALWL